MWWRGNVEEVFNFGERSPWLLHEYHGLAGGESEKNARTF